METLVEAKPLMTLARSRDPSDRERLLARLVDICEAGAGTMAAGAASSTRACHSSSDTLPCSETEPASEPSAMESLSRSEIVVRRRLSFRAGCVKRARRGSYFA